MQSRPMIIAGGVSFIVGAIAFVLIFSYLAANFNYPAVLDGRAAEVLPRLRTGGTTMRVVWAIYAFIPLLLLPGAVGSYCACESSRARMTLALIAASVAAFAMCIGLLRWPSIHWVLAESYSHAGAETRAALDGVFTGLNLYLGNYLGEFLGEIALASFFLLTGCSMLAEPHFPKWSGWSGIAFALLFLIGALRNVTTAVQFVADTNNILLPLWMVLLGIALIRYTKQLPSDGV